MNKKELASIVIVCFFIAIGLIQCKKEVFNKQSESFAPIQLLEQIEIKDEISGGNHSSAKKYCGMPSPNGIDIEKKNNK